MTSNTLSGPKPGRALTGKGVLLILVGFFGSVSLVNAYMIHYALSTFSGEVDDHPYETGVAYNHELDAAMAQAALGWKVSVTTSPVDGGRTQVTVDARDAAGSAKTNLDVGARLESPVDRARDHSIVLALSPDGLYRGSLPATPGQWDLVIDAREPGTDHRFLSRARLRLD